MTKHFLYRHILEYVDIYESLENADLSHFSAIVLPMGIDEIYLYRFREKIAQFLESGGVVLSFMSDFMRILPHSSGYIQSPVAIRDREVKFTESAAARVIFNNVREYDINYRRGVKGFFNRGYFDVSDFPHSIEWILSDNAGQCVGYIDRDSTNGIILSTANADLLSFGLFDNTTARRMGINVLQWLLLELKKRLDNAHLTQNTSIADSKNTKTYGENLAKAQNSEIGTTEVTQADSINHKLARVSEISRQNIESKVSINRDFGFSKSHPIFLENQQGSATSAMSATNPHLHTSNSVIPLGHNLSLRENAESTHCHFEQSEKSLSDSKDFTDSAICRHESELTSHCRHESGSDRNISSNRISSRDSSFALQIENDKNLDSSINATSHFDFIPDKSKQNLLKPSLKNAIICGGSAFNHYFFSNKNAKYAHCFDKRVYFKELDSINLHDFDYIVLASRLKAAYLEPHRQTFFNYLNSGGHIISFGEIMGDYLPNVIWKNYAVNFWWWLTDGANLPLYAIESNGERTQDKTRDGLFAKMPVNWAKWHYHGAFYPPKNAQKILVNELDESIIYKDTSFKGHLFITSLDPEFHLGQGFMPTTERFFDTFMQWVEAEILRNKNGEILYECDKNTKDNK